MTAFNNIKTNNWPAASNDLDDFLVLELPLNDQAALTSSRRDIVAGSTVLHPKRTLTNTGVSTGASGTVYSTSGTITGSVWNASHGIHSAFRPGYLLYGTPAAANSGVFASHSGTFRYTFDGSGLPVNNDIKIYFWRNGGSIKVNAGESNVQTDNTSSGYTVWTIPAGTVSTLKNVELTNSTNTGPYWSGIEIDGVQIADAPGGPKKHYDDNATLVSGNSNYLQTVDMASVSDSDYTYECYALADGTPSSWSLFHTNPTSRKGILALFTSATNIQLYFGNGGSWTSNHNFTVSVDNAWHHYAVVRQNGGVVSLYMDGVLKGTHTPGAHTHGDLVIGRQSGDNNLYWNGPVQDFRVYRTAKYTANFTPPGAILG